MSKQSESKRGVDLISGVLLFVNFLGEFPRSSTHLFVYVLLGCVVGYIVRLLEASQLRPDQTQEILTRQL